MNMIDHTGERDRARDLAARLEEELAESKEQWQGQLNRLFVKQKSLIARIDELTKDRDQWKKLTESWYDGYRRAWRKYHQCQEQLITMEKDRDYWRRLVTGEPEPEEDEQ